MAHTPRHFTRGQVAEFFLSRWGKLFPQQRVAVATVVFLPELSPATWRLTYTITETLAWPSLPGERVRYVDILIAEFAGVSGPFLNVVGVQDLPEGCASVAEEDAELARRLAEWRAQHGTNV